MNIHGHSESRLVEMPNEVGGRLDNILYANMLYLFHYFLEQPICASLSFSKSQTFFSRFELGYSVLENSNNYHDSLSFFL